MLLGLINLKKKKGGAKKRVCVSQLFIFTFITCVVLGSVLNPGPEDPFGTESFIGQEEKETAPMQPVAPDLLLCVHMYLHNSHCIHSTRVGPWQNTRLVRETRLPRTENTPSHLSANCRRVDTLRCCINWIDCLMQNEGLCTSQFNWFTTKWDKWSTGWLVCLIPYWSDTCIDVLAIWNLIVFDRKFHAP